MAIFNSNYNKDKIDESTQGDVTTDETSDDMAAQFKKAIENVRMAKDATMDAEEAMPVIVADPAPTEPVVKKEPENPFGQVYPLCQTLIDRFNRCISEQCDVLAAPVTEEQRMTDFATIEVFPAKLDDRLNLSNTKDHPTFVAVNVYGAPVREDVDVRHYGDLVVRSVAGEKRCRVNDFMCAKLSAVNRENSSEGMQQVHRMKLFFDIAPRF